jgi:phage terminase small subunit
MARGGDCVAGRPPKPVKLLKMEGRSHRTKAELEAREKAEKQLLTGQKMKAWPEVRGNKLARKEFNRVKNLLEAIGHNDALHEAVINRYCLLTAECKEIEDTIEQLREDLAELDKARLNGEIAYTDYLEEKGNIHDRIIAWDKKLMDKRKMLLQIEKENVMTIMAALRSIPKKPVEETEEDPMARLLGGEKHVR